MQPGINESESNDIRTTEEDLITEEVEVIDLVDTAEEAGEDITEAMVGRIGAQDNELSM